MDRLEQTLGDGRGVLVPPAYGVADVVWTVFLARMEFVGMGAELQKRPALARYWRAMQARPSFGSYQASNFLLNFSPSITWDSFSATRSWSSRIILF